MTLPTRKTGFGGSIVWSDLQRHDTITN